MPFRDIPFLSKKENRARKKSIKAGLRIGSVKISDYGGKIRRKKK